MRHFTGAVSFTWGIAMHPTIIFVITAALLVAVVSDLHSRRIPNWLVFPLMGGGISIQFWLQGWNGCAASLEGVFLIVLLYSIPFLAGQMGAGDIKLLAAIAAWVGPHQALIAFAVAGISGGIFALIWVGVYGSIPLMLRNVCRLLCFWRRGRPRSGEDEMRGEIPQPIKIPYSPAIAIGTVASFLLTHS